MAVPYGFSNYTLEKRYDSTTTHLESRKNTIHVNEGFQTIMDGVKYGRQESQDNVEEDGHGPVENLDKKKRRREYDHPYGPEDVLPVHLFGSSDARSVPLVCFSVMSGRVVC